MPRLLIFALVSLTTNMLLATPLKWYDGVIVLEDGQVIRGNLSIEGYYDLVLIRQDSLPRVIPAHKVKAIYFYDESENINRRYVSIANSKTRSVSQLYEVVVGGTISIVRKIRDNFSSPVNDATDYNYYVYFDQELISPLKFLKSEYFNLFSSRVKAFCCADERDTSNQDALASVIHFAKRYNQLSNQGAITMANSRP